MDPPSSPPTTSRRGWVHGRLRPNGSLHERCAPGNAPLKHGRSRRGLRNGLSVRAIGRVQAIAHAASESRPGLRTPEIVRNHLHDGRGAVRIAHVLHRSPGTATVLVQVPRSSGRRDDQSLTSLVGAMVGPTRNPTITYPPDDLTRTAARAGAHHPRSGSCAVGWRAAVHSQMRCFGGPAAQSAMPRGAWLASAAGPGPSAQGRASCAARCATDPWGNLRGPLPTMRARPR